MLPKRLRCTTIKDARIKSSRSKRELSWRFAANCRPIGGREVLLLRIMELIPRSRSDIYPINISRLDRHLKSIIDTSLLNFICF